MRDTGLGGCCVREQVHGFGPVVLERHGALGAEKGDGLLDVSRDEGHRVALLPVIVPAESQKFAEAC